MVGFDCDALRNAIIFLTRDMGEQKGNPLLAFVSGCGIGGFLAYVNAPPWIPILIIAAAFLLLWSRRTPGLADDNDMA